MMRIAKYSQSKLSFCNWKVTIMSLGYFDTLIYPVSSFKIIGCWALGIYLRLRCQDSSLLQFLTQTDTNVFEFIFWIWNITHHCNWCLKVPQFDCVGFAIVLSQFALDHEFSDILTHLSVIIVFDLASPASVRHDSTSCFTCRSLTVRSHNNWSVMLNQHSRLTVSFSLLFVLRMIFLILWIVIWCIFVNGLDTRWAIC